ncbi:MAG: hypothetical protein GX998_11520 [Firmicutes bacterium]|nr:hypothetical protein [Bacillota bacterium]
MSREWVLEEDLLEEVASPVVSEEGLGQFCRHVLTKLLCTWGILILLSYQLYLISDRQILSHPVDAFIDRIGLVVQTVTVNATVELPSVRSFTELKPQVIRAGRLMGVSADTGVLDARAEYDSRVLSWTAIDREGRQHTITGAISETGTADLHMEMTDWGCETKIKDSITEMVLTAGRFGKIKSSSVQVEGIVDQQCDISPEKWIQPWRLVDLQVVEAGPAVRLQGITPDLDQRRRKPIAFTLSVVPDGTTRGRLILSVYNQ